jgi:starch synthase (maltosyl-transferring)
VSTEPVARIHRDLPLQVTAVVIENAQPVVDGGRFSAKAIAGDPLSVSADVFTHGHDIVRAVARTRHSGARRWSTAPMHNDGNDRFSGTVIPQTEGPFEIEICGCVDELATWARDARRRVEARRPDPFEAEVGARLLGEAAAALASSGASEAAARVDELAALAKAAVTTKLLNAIAKAGGALALRAMPAVGTVAYRMKAVADRPRAAFSTWYELFPRSASSDPRRPGTLIDVIARLDYVAGLGFDVLYLPPVHPIGTTARKGKGNKTTAHAGDVGSPWAIGSASGGHTAIAPELGTLEDFDALVGEAAARGLEIALDLAFQCSPDHPWVSEHPEWFGHRPDGSIACAENPPKRYEDIYPIDFSTPDRDALWRALAAVVFFWTKHGVRIFRVDNPHTKPFAFWEWLIGEVKREIPEVLFLSEAFTRPKVMHRLAKLGFDQSYTYFTWRNSKWELEEYFRELTSAPGVAYFRPNVWPNTPDILAESLQHGGRPSFITRLVLAAGLCANYGIYGPLFELCWDEPAAPFSEEYRHSEKYEVHHHDLADKSSIAAVITRVNAARRAYPALQRDTGLHFHHVDNDQILCWSKRSGAGDCVIGVVNLDPKWAQSGFVHLDAGAIGLDPGVDFAVNDALNGERYSWVAGENFLKLDPKSMPAHLLAIEATA